MDQNVIVGLNCQVDIGDTTQVANINVFLVSLRKEATNAMNITNEVTGAMDPLSVDTDYVENFKLNVADMTLNSAKFKVHAAKFKVNVDGCGLARCLILERHSRERKERSVLSLLRDE